MKKIFLLFLFLFLSKSTYSQTTPEDIIKKFFETYQKNTGKAIDDIYATNSWTSQMQDAITTMKKTIKTYPEEMGNYYGFEMITKQKSTERFVLYVYMIRYDRQPMKVNFELYKPNDKWMLYSLNFATDIDEDVEMAAKMYTQNPNQN
jgi:hypothetical protein